MMKPIFYKEWIKIRWPWLTLAAANGLLMAYIYVETRRLFALDHAEIVWYRVLHLGRIHYEQLRYGPTVTGLMLAIVQFLPEMTGERLRLSLHLPVSPHRVILAHVGVGLTAAGLIIALDLAGLALITARYFPVEAAATALLTALPWCLAGLGAYIGGALGLLEPDYRLKLFNLAVAAAVVNLFLRPAEPGSAVFFTICMGAPLLLLVPAVLLPAYRFRFRRVSG